MKKIKFHLKSFFETARSFPRKSILQWFLLCYCIFAIIFFIALLPLISYCRETFTELEITKSSQQMDFGISRLETTAEGVASMTQSLSSDVRFLPFFYREPNYSSISVSVRHQMRHFMNSMVFPLEMVSDCILQFSDKTVVSTNFSRFDEAPPYYPNLFQVASLSYEEWEGMLVQGKSGFICALPVTSIGQTYEALIYSVPWVNDSWLFACLNMKDVTQSLVGKANAGVYSITLTTTGGVNLYTNLLSPLNTVHSITKQVPSSNLLVTVHIPHSVTDNNITPLYYFLTLYLVLCVLVLIIMILSVSYLSARPLFKIIDLLDKVSDTAGNANAPDTQAKPLAYGFNYIQERIVSYANELDTSRDTIDHQRQALQIRYMEKALHSSLSIEADYDAFYSCFPDFPDSFCMIMLGLIEHPDNEGVIYPNALSLIQLYLQSTLQDVYIQQLNNLELLLFVDEEQFSASEDIINHLIANINQKEPCYHAWGLVSKFYNHPKSISIAYMQLQEMYSWISLTDISSLCHISNTRPTNKADFQMSDTQAIYSALIHGNTEMALLKLQHYADSLSNRNRSVFEMFRSILLCVRQEYPSQLIDIEIPNYHAHLDMYKALEDAICAFCSKMQPETSLSEADPFAKQLLDYVNQHFADENLCYATLADHFQCSVSKVRKSFSLISDVSVTAYIENKRMALADELLHSRKYSVSEVAKLCGFASHTTFYRVYRKNFGHAPSVSKQE